MGDTIHGNHQNPVLEYGNDPVDGVDDDDDVDGFSEDRWAIILIDIVNGNVYFENIIFDGSKAYDDILYMIKINHHAKAWLKNCTFKTGTKDIVVCNNASVFIDNCSFFGGYGVSSNSSKRKYNNNSIAIDIDVEAKEIIINNCKFMHYGSRPCIFVRGPFVRNKTLYSGKLGVETVKMKISNNMFYNNLGYPMACHAGTINNGHLTVNSINNPKIEIKNNKFGGFNGVKVSNGETNIDENTMYVTCL